MYMYVAWWVQNSDFDHGGGNSNVGAVLQIEMHVSG